jgi:hypothetical protein
MTLCPWRVFNFTEFIDFERGPLEVQGARGNVYKHKLEIQYVAIKLMKIPALSTARLHEYKRVSSFGSQFLSLKLS